MGKGFALLGLLPLLIACGGKTEHSRELDGSPALDSDARSDVAGSSNRWTPEQSYGGASTTDPADTPEDVVAIEPCRAAPVPKPHERLPPSSPLTTGAATIHAVSTNGLELETALGVSYFGWVGPPLTEFFAPGEEVEVSTFLNWGEPEDDWHIVESDSVMIATMVGSWNAPLSPDPGWQAGPTSPTGLPTLNFVNAGCCQRDDTYECDYSNLLAVLDPESLLITQGSTGTFRGWTITNLGARTEGEWQFSLGVTVIGPARHPK